LVRATSLRNNGERAAKAEMMQVDTLSYSLDLGGFAIDWEIRVEPSLRETRAYQGQHGNEFVFAVGSTWLKIGGARFTVSSEFHTANVIETLKIVEVRLASPPAFPALDKLVARGGLCAWMEEYWTLVEQDRTTAADERNYDLLFPLCVMAERDGCVAIYDYLGVPTVEVSAKADSGHEPVLPLVNSIGES
jgi:hypothetical protein